MLLAHTRHVSDLGPHGQPLSEATDPQADPSVPGGWHYEATEKGVTDYAQLALATARNAYFDKFGDRMTEAQKAAKTWSVRKVIND